MSDRAVRNVAASSPHLATSLALADGIELSLVTIRLEQALTLLDDIAEPPVIATAPPPVSLA